jgi:hypothetical protein
VKAKFYLKTPPAKPGEEEQEPVEYIEIDPDDTGKQVVAHVASDEEKSRFAAEYEEFQKNQEENGDQAVTSNPPQPVPVTVLAAAPLGREAEFTKQVTQPASTPMTATQTVGTMNVQEMKVGESGEETASPSQPAQPTSGTSPTPTPTSTESTPESTTEAPKLTEVTAEDAKVLIQDTDDVKQLEAMRTEEENGKNRITVLDAIDKRIDELDEEP